MFEFEEVLFEMESEIDEAVENFEIQLSKISAGRANPALLRGVKVLYYEELTPLETIATVASPEPMQLIIKPFDISIVRDVVKALSNSGLDINPVNEGDKIRITFQPLTTQRRKELVKNLSKLIEDARVKIRQARQHANSKVQNANNISEDAIESHKEEIQKLTEMSNNKISKIAKKKEEELMTI